MMDQMAFRGREETAALPTYTLYMAQTQDAAHPTAPKTAQRYQASPPLASSNLHRFPIRKLHHAARAEGYQLQ